MGEREPYRESLLVTGGGRGIEQQRTRKRETRSDPHPHTNIQTKVKQACIIRIYIHFYIYSLSCIIIPHSLIAHHFRRGSSFSFFGVPPGVAPGVSSPSIHLSRKPWSRIATPIATDSPESWYSGLSRACFTHRRSVLSISSSGGGGGVLSTGGEGGETLTLGVIRGLRLSRPRFRALRPPNDMKHMEMMTAAWPYQYILFQASMEFLKSSKRNGATR